ncbi:metalloregulator ArsR/SmtB family transcription factor [Nocardiopsis sp. YSL2]|uniref:ArsR/SmtB family transcription factor n=1 Tax=Nocardiopsis sp. YSL2 TaxID=2939492 RepID=UPI0026F43CC9|nr:metalloregulator ArsR/SmtB family transcription factor [Nocardiopsis sp. YSL2]
MNADSKRCGLDENSPYVEYAVEILTLLADATRVRIILALRGGELSVNELAERLDKPGPSVSQHLAKLRMGRVVACRREGNRMYYSLANEHARQLVADAVYQAEHALEVEPAHHRARVAPDRGAGASTGGAAGRPPGCAGGDTADEATAPADGTARTEGDA